MRLGWVTSLGGNTESSPELLALQTRKHIFYICPRYTTESSKLRRAGWIPGYTCEVGMPYTGQVKEASRKEKISERVGFNSWHY